MKMQSHDPSDADSTISASCSIDGHRPKFSWRSTIVGESNATISYFMMETHGEGKGYILGTKYKESSPTDPRASSSPPLGSIDVFAFLCDQICDDVDSSVLQKIYLANFRSCGTHPNTSELRKIRLKPIDIGGGCTLYHHNVTDKYYIRVLHTNNADISWHMVELFPVYICAKRDGEILPNHFANAKPIIIRKDDNGLGVSLYVNGASYSLNDCVFKLSNRCLRLTSDRSVFGLYYTEDLNDPPPMNGTDIRIIMKVYYWNKCKSKNEKEFIKIYHRELTTLSKLRSEPQFKSDCWLDETTFFPHSKSVGVFLLPAMETLHMDAMQRSSEIKRTSLSQSATQKAEGHLAEEVMLRVATLHAAGIVHLDLSWENIVFGPERKMVLIDFGESRLTTVKEGEPSICVDAGTINRKRDFYDHTFYYCVVGEEDDSQESTQISTQLDMMGLRKLDCWQVGIMLFYLFSGKYPVDYAKDVFNKSRVEGSVERIPEESFEFYLGWWLKNVGVVLSDLESKLKQPATQDSDKVQDGRTPAAAPSSDTQTPSTKLAERLDGLLIKNQPVGSTYWMVPLLRLLLIDIQEINFQEDVNPLDVILKSKWFEDLKSNLGNRDEELNKFFDLRVHYSNSQGITSAASQTASTASTLWISKVH